MTRFCTNCGAALEDDACFCTSCGTPVEQEELAATCPSCGAPLEDGAAFCMNCGAAVGASSVASATTAIPATPVTPAPVVSPVPSAAETAPTASAEPLQATMVMPKPSEPAAWSFANEGGPAQASSQPSKKKPILMTVLAAVVFVVAVVGILLVVDPFGWKVDTSQSAQQEETVASEDATDSEDGTDSKDAKDSDSADKSSSSTDDDDDTTSDSDSDSTSSTDTADHSTGVNTASTDNDYYVLPESSTRVYSASELAGLSLWDLSVARNEIYARYGRGFKDENLQNYFNSKSWYTRTYSPEDFDAMTSPLTDTERANIEVIKSLES